MAKKDAAKKSEEELEEELEEEQAEGSEEEGDEDEEEASDEGDEEDEDEDEPVAAAPKAKHAVAATAPAAEDPNWWVPHLVLGVLVVGGVLGFFGAFTSTLAPLLKRTPAASASASAAPAPAASSAKAPGAEPAQPPPRPTPTAAPNNDPVFAAKHVLVTFKGARNSKNERTKEEAKKRADEALTKLKAGTKFEDVVGEFSDEPGAKATGGNLGRFKKDAYDPSIVGTVMKLEVGKTSEIFESPFGYEIVLRTE